MLKDSINKDIDEDDHKEFHLGGGEFLKSAVYGGLDGSLTTYAIVMGSLGV